MITTIKTFKALNDMLKLKFPDIKIQHEDIRTIINRPCFYINLLSNKSGKSADEFSENIDSYDIIYFATEKQEGFLELLKIKDQLNTVFKSPLAVDDTFIKVDDVEFSINKDDYVLNCLVNIAIAQRDTEEIDVLNDNTELIDTLVLEDEEITNASTD